MTTTRIPVIPRREFARQFGNDYSSGQHVTFIGPTQRGKTTLCLDLLSKVISPERPCVILAGKPPSRDKAMDEIAPKMLNLRVVEEWPPTRTFRDRKRNGYVLRPEQKMRSRADDEANLKAQFSKAIMDNYRKKTPTITVADEAYLVQVTLKLKGDYEQPLMRGAPHNAMWSLIQRGAYVSYLSYNSPRRAGTTDCGREMNIIDCTHSVGFAKGICSGCQTLTQVCVLCEECKRCRTNSPPNPSTGHPVTSITPRKG